MIGVIADRSELDVVAEFFELFKTPWEFYRKGRRYDVLLCSGNCEDPGPAGLVIFYAGRKIRFDDEHNLRTAPCDSDFLSYHGRRVPIYGDAVHFVNQDRGLLFDADARQSAVCLDRSDDGIHARIGYDLFREVRTLLTDGQPAANAGIPVLELHIQLLRELITTCGIPLVEVPAVPEGYSLIACLTHDVDSPSLREHGWDHTTFGFLYRALFGSVIKLLQGRTSVQRLLTNWAAALKLPFVQMGFAKDFWRGFADSYLELEGGLPSTFFVIPFRNLPGRKSQGQAPGFRAARYCARDIADIIQKLIGSSREIGLHGIDAWIDTSSALQELEEIRGVTGTYPAGARMHWLYCGGQSPVALENAGARYDSTVGYNETVGYRAGTTQAYKPLSASQLLELPLHAMDTALFYPAYLGLSQTEAATLLRTLVDNAVQFGGCLTVNWHDRSLAPERNWADSYLSLIEELKHRGACFLTAGHAVSWFQKRRSVRFETDSAEPGAVRAVVPFRGNDNLPALRLRLHNAPDPAHVEAQPATRYLDLPFNESVDSRISCGVRC